MGRDAWQAFGRPWGDAERNLAVLLHGRNPSNAATLPRSLFHQAVTHWHWFAVAGLSCLFLTGLAVWIGSLNRSLRRSLAKLEASEARLRQQQEATERLARHSRTVAWEVDAEGRFTYLSPAASLVYGYEPEEIIGRRFFYDLHPESGRETFKAEVLALFARGEAIEGLENDIVAADGGRIRVKTFGIPLVNGHGKLLGYRGSDVDITEQKRANDEVQRFAQRLEVATRGAGVGVWDLDLRSGELVWDETMHELYASPKEGEPPSSELWKKRLHPEDRDAAADLLQKASRREAEFDTSFRLQLHDGGLRHIRALATVTLDSVGSPTHMIGVNWDITETVQARRQIEQNEARLRRVLDAFFGFVGILKLDATVHDVNRAALEVSDLELADVVGQRFDQTPWWAHCDDTRRRIREACEAARRGEVSRFETTYQAKEGKLGNVDVTFGPLYDERGRVDSIIGFGVDVSERVAAQQRLDLAMRAASIGVWDWNTDSDKTFFSDTFYTMLGYEPGELPMRLETWKSLCHPDDLDASLSDIGRHLRGETPVYVNEHRLRRRDGSWMWIRDVGEVVAFDEAGEPKRLIGLHIDIDEHVRREAELRELTTAMDAAKDCVFLFDGETLRFVYANDGMTHQIGYTAEELRGMTPVALMPDFDERAFRDLIRPLVDQPGRALDLRTRHRHRNGETIPIEITLQFISSLGPNGRFIAVVRDVSEQLEAEARLENAKNAAEAASQAKSEFLANMSHEIRTPMTAILGYTDLLTDALADSDGDASLREASESIQRNGRHLLQVINDILDMSKIEAGRMAVERIPTYPAQIVEEVASLVRPRAVEKGIEVRIRYDTSLPAAIACDPTRLRQILLNLAGNAVKFTEAGTVTLRVAHRPETRSLAIAVEDTGPGMTAEQLAVISRFDAFTQADASTTRRHGGSGLGLRISHALAGMLGGGVAVASEIGVGSVFTLEIEAEVLEESPSCEEGPLPGAATTHETPIAAQPTLDKERPLAGTVILLAEDGPDNQRLVTSLLEKAGASVRVAENGRVAVETIEAGNPDHLPDLVLMDIQMPELDGYGATRRLRAGGFTRTIIALTAHAMAGDRERCVAAGCDDYLTKPIDRHQLVTTCGAWLEKTGQRRTTPADRQAGNVSTASGEKTPSTDAPAADGPLVSELANDPDMRSLVELYVEDLAGYADQLASLRDRGEAHELALLAHRIKGSGSSHGFPAVTTKAKRLEELAKEEADPQAIEAAVRALADLCRRAQAVGEVDELSGMDKEDTTNA